ncbi:CDP-diacylglycerol---serine O-phosphatidyltransferase [Catalinimonas alkaloidigena]|uniref:CDP-diacylglycerol--serine O-phosphatidyltransferase n=1 Tax=Catalinimonas alkaloidigena TaxID=1075417 RepID=A0A1G9M1U2_9BACT|nr:CDP-diacylglycerol--serine O-phosphatidyltransferase [Catalinimonas alkaloidigena]SDL68114.1 CDP-diacylglycerol---serine O-phosphatidyltransferase [Catalinimonas alkaloidigena]
MTIRRHIPNLLTCGNLLCGCFGVLETYRHHLNVAAVLMAVAALLDFADGFVARALHAHSPIGKELDSLADMVTFGVLPGAILFMLLEQAGAGPLFTLGSLVVEGAHIAFLIPIFSALRLAKFNIDTRQSDQFIGVPTPANALFFASFPLILTGRADTLVGAWLQNPWLLGALAVVMSLMLVAPLPLFALKFKSFRLADNRLRYLFILLSLVLLFALSYVAVPLIVLLYIALSVLKLLFTS